MQPIWKDYYVDLGKLNDAEAFRILCNDEVIYVGKAHRRPGENGISVRMNDICADYLQTEWKGKEDFSVLPTFSLQTMIANISTGDMVWTTKASVQFYSDWSHDYGFNPLDKGLSCPVNGRFAIGTPLPFSLLDCKELEIEINDGKYVYYAPQHPGESGTFMLDFSTDYNEEVLKDGDIVGLTSADLGYYQFYKLVDTCARYALYYRNAYGGVDMLLIEGNHSETDSLTRHERVVEYDNSDISNRGRANYVNEIQKRMTLHTSWLLGDEASRMHHLLNATEVYLFDIEKRQMIPVVLTNTTTEYKTHKGNGGRLVNYAIEVAFANDRTRR